VSRNPEVRFPNGFRPPHVSKCKMASFPSFPGEDLRVLWCSSKRVWCAWRDGDPFTTAHGLASVRPPTHRLSGLETNRHVEAVVHTRGQYM